ncbi:hypothetical protein FF38_11346 [Lucilia cuprina]|uniref:Uncharacterized protein n=1 Tax=Lucilia cuprina TaxID=7375 RepID=A0A0L0C642_LUCCU|nr:hypothetical protein FF38_11346 [Lucilia cuprina]
MYPVGQQTQWTPSPTRPQSPSQQQTSFDTLTCKLKLKSLILKRKICLIEIY